MVLMRTPKDDIAAADDAPSSDVTLYFSEGVQASTSSGKNVVANDGSTSNTIPVDNSQPDQGKITVVGNTVTIDPFDGLASDQVVTKFATPGLAFTSLKAQNTTLPYAPREGSTLYYTAGKLMLYGGKKSGTCTSELYPSSTGKTWAIQASTGSPGPVAN